jgi:hypothetical protein
LAAEASVVVVRLPLALLTFSLACAFDSGGAGSAEGSLGETAGDSTSGASAGTSGGSNTSTNTGGSSATTSPTTSTSASTTASTSTTAGDTGDSSGAVDGGSTSGVADEGSTSIEESSEGGAEASTGEMKNDYPMCGAMGACEGDAECTQWAANNQPFGNHCSPPCTVTDDCPPPPDSDAMPYCSQNWDYCLLVCETGNCPTGMSCEDTQNGPRCMWLI